VWPPFLFYIYIYMAAASEESNLSYNHAETKYNFKDGETLYFSDSWNDHSAKIRGTLRRVDGDWQIEYTSGYFPRIEKLNISRLENGRTKLYKYTPPAEMPRFIPKLTAENHAYRNEMRQFGHPSLRGGSKKRTRRRTRKIKKSRSMKKFRK